jgi:hypothetical protein
MSHALYYPTIEFQDIGSLKKALLVWDRIFRIVPRGYTPNDSLEIREATNEGVIVDLFLDDSERSEAAYKFTNFYSRIESPSSSLIWPAGFSSEDFGRLSQDKIDVRLLPLFQQLARTLTDDGFLELSNELVGSYMFYLAKTVAQKRALEMLTDSSDNWIVGSYFANEGNFDEQVYEEKTGAYLCNLAIDDLLPDQLEHVPMDDLLRFVNKFRGERSAFQRELKILRDAISRCNNKKHARYIVGDFVKKFEKAKAEYRSAVAPFAKREFSSILSVGIPVTISILSLPTTPGADPYSAFRIGIGILLGAVSALAMRELIPKEKTVGSFLVSAEHLTRTPNGLLHRKFHEFMND